MSLPHRMLPLSRTATETNKRSWKGPVVAEWPVVRRIVAHSQNLRVQAALPELSVRLARGLRAGRPIDHVLVETGSAPLTPDGLARAARQVESGRPILAALEEWAASAESNAERLLAATLVIGVRWGGDLAAAVDLIGGGIRDDLELAARRRVLLVQATMSAAVLIALPVCFAVVASVIRGGVVFSGTLGIALAIGGLGLDVLGGLWMRALMRSLR